MIDTNNISPDEVIDEMKRLITDLSDYSFQRLRTPSTTQMNMNKFLK